MKVGVLAGEPQLRGCRGEAGVEARQNCSGPSGARFPHASFNPEFCTVGLFSHASMLGVRPATTVFCVELSQPLHIWPAPV